MSWNGQSWTETPLPRGHATDRANQVGIERTLQQEIPAGTGIDHTLHGLRISAPAEHQDRETGIERRNRTRVRDTRLGRQRADHDGISPDTAQRLRGFTSLGHAGNDANARGLEYLPEPASHKGPIPDEHYPHERVLMVSTLL
jgi:hypothetical protein